MRKSLLGLSAVVLAVGMSVGGLAHAAKKAPPNDLRSKIDSMGSRRSASSHPRG